MLSLVELHRAAEVLRADRMGARLTRVVQDGDERVALVLSGGGEHPPKERLVLRLSAAQASGRISEVEGTPAAPPTPPGFAQFLKAHFEGARLAEVRTEPDDRILRLVFRGGEGERALLLQLLGPRSNLYALGAGDRIDAVLRPLRESRRELSRGEAWRASEGRAPRSGDDRFEGVPDARLLAAIEAEYAEQERSAAEDELTRRITQALRKQRAGIERKLRKLANEREAGRRSDHYRRCGELLKGVLSEVVPGASSVVARDFETGESVEIELDPKLDAAKNLELYFRRHKKAERTLRRAEQEIGATEARLEEQVALEAEFEVLREAADEEAISAFAERSDIARMLTRFFPAPRQEEKKSRRVFRVGKRELPTRLVPKRYRASGGLEVWVGKNDEGNDVLTMRLARGNDLFFHLEASPGSHVILRSADVEEPDSEAVLEAAELAVHFSKQKNAARASVHVASCKDISKPRGAKPGLVYVHRGRTIGLRRDPERLARILDARIED